MKMVNIDETIQRWFIISIKSSEGRTDDSKVNYLFLDTLDHGRRLDSLAGAETKEMTERPLKTEKRWVKFVAMSTMLNC